MKSRPNRHQGLDNLTEFMVEDILSMSPDELAAEVAEAYGDPRALAKRFDDALLRPALTVSGSNPAARGFATPSGAGTATGRGKPLARLTGGLAYARGFAKSWLEPLKSGSSFVFSRRLALAAVSTACIALFAVIFVERDGLLDRWGLPAEGDASSSQGAQRPAPRRDLAMPKRDELQTGTDPADASLANLNRAIATNPGDVASLFQRGQLFASKGNYRLAVADLNAVISLRPGDAEALNHRCRAYAMLGDLQPALRDCDGALAIRPQYADALVSRGLVNLKRGLPRSAIADYDAALRISPNEAASLYGRGIAEKQTGNAAEGNRDVARAKALRPDIADEFAKYGVP
jgi:tetratricopeptide (TPR) repeat protein